MAVSIDEGALKWSAQLDTSQLKDSIKEVQDSISQIQRKADEQANAIERLARKAAAGAAAYLSVQAATNFISQMVRVRGEFQQLEVAFTTMLGSKERADKLLAQVTEFAATTPYGLDEVAKATKQLLAFGIEAETIEKTLRQLGDVAAGIGAPLGDIAYLFGTIKTQGKAMTVDIRQFANRGIPIYEALAEVMGVAAEEVGKLIEAGKIGFPEIQKVFEKLTEEGSKFGGLMEEQSKTLTGQIANLQDSIVQMYNELGKSQEGTMNDVISSLTYLVENYERVLDIIKLLIAAYGSYRAALIVQNAVTAISTQLTKGYTVAELLRYRAMLLSEKAAKLLNATLLKNPIATVITGITTLVAAFVIFRKEAQKAKTAQEYLSEAQAEATDQLARAKSEIMPYVEQLKKANLSERERVDIYKKLREINPDIVKGLDEKTISYEKLKGNVDAYVDALRNQYRMEANRAAIQNSIKDEQSIEKKLQDLEDYRQRQRDRLAKSREQMLKRTDEAAKRWLGNYEANLAKIDYIEKDLETRLKTRLEAQQKITKELVEGQLKDEPGDNAKEYIESLKDINEKIKQLRENQEKSTNRKEYLEFEKQIEELEERKKKITGESKKEIAEGNKLENERNSLLEKRIDLLEKIGDLERDAAITGLTDREQAIANINQRYDQQLRAIEEINREIERFNKKHPKMAVSLVGQNEVDRINAARQVELDNYQYKRDAENYLESIQRKASAFEELRRIQETGDQELIQATRKTLQEETQGYQSFIDFLKAEYDRLFSELNFDGTDDIGTVTKFEGIYKKLEEEQRKRDEDEKKRSIAQFQALLNGFDSYQKRKQAIAKKYDDLMQTLEKNRANMTAFEYEEREHALNEARERELNDLENDTVRQSALYRKLNEDIIRFTRDQIKARIRELKNLLKTSTTLTPEMIADIQSVIGQYDALLDDTNATAATFNDVAKGLADASAMFGDIAGALEGTNDELAETLQLLSDVTAIGADAAKAIASFASGQIGAGIGATVNVITKILTLGKRQREERRRQQEELKNFITQQYIGEQEINLLYQERAREQVKLNKLRAQGLKDERDLLTLQKNQLADQFKDVFAELQKETFKTVKNLSGFFGTGGLLNKEFIGVGKLLGKSYEEIEQLFMRGQLEGRAKELFEALKRIKDSGADIDRMLEENANAVRELFTGTTADGIATSIIEGFKAGKRSASDFADDFQGMMEQALIQSLSMQALEGPLKSFFEDFASLSESGDGLDAGEIDRLRSMYNSIIENAAEQFQQLQDIAGINFSSSGSGGNTLTGAIKGMTEQQADLLAGQFGGLRITAAEHLAVAKTQLDTLGKIEYNTFRLHELRDILRRLERDGIKVR